MSQTEYWICLQKYVMGSAYGKKLLEFFEADPYAVFSALKNGEVPYEFMQRINYDKISPFGLEDAFAVMSEVRKNGWEIITYDSECYPERLREISDPPLVLFADGDTELLKNSKNIAIVGTREASDTARCVAFRLGFRLSASGVCVISGGAEGTDSCAHEGGMLGLGRTVAVLGCGLGNKYTEKMGFVRDRVKQYGVFVTESFPFEGIRRFSFQKRNRLISGIADGTVIVSAGEKSGALITAEIAEKQSRALFVVASDICKSDGCSRLIEKGVPEISSASEIWHTLSNRWGSTPKNNFIYKTLHSNGLDGFKFLRPDKVTAEEYAMYACDITLEDYDVSQVLESKGVTASTESDRTAASTPVGGEPCSSALTEETAEREILQKTEKRKSRVGNKEKVCKKSGVTDGEEIPTRALPDTLSAEAKTVYEVLGKGKLSTDGLQAVTGLGISDILGAVTELELEDAIDVFPGNMISRK